MNNKFSQRTPEKQDVVRFNTKFSDPTLYEMLGRRCRVDTLITEVKISAFNDKYPYKILSPMCIIPICGESFQVSDCMQSVCLLSSMILDAQTPYCTCLHWDVYLVQSHTLSCGRRCNGSTRVSFPRHSATTFLVPSSVLSQ